MSARFEDLVATMVDPIVDQHFDELFTLWPMTSSPNGRSRSDPDRPMVNAIGVFHESERGPRSELGNRYRRGNDLRALVNDPGRNLLVDRRHFAQPPRQGDEVEIRGERYQVVSARYDGVSQWELRLTQ